MAAPPRAGVFTPEDISCCWSPTLVMRMPNRWSRSRGVFLGQQPPSLGAPAPPPGKASELVLPAHSESLAGFYTGRTEVQLGPLGTKMGPAHEGFSFQTPSRAPALPNAGHSHFHFRFFFFFRQSTMLFLPPRLRCANCQRHG